ncbi:MAG: DUF2149 domain-containing protein [Coriobacteriales bacterium]
MPRMRRSMSQSSLQGSKLIDDGDQDPMSSMGNLMDVMLVFACGLLLALIVRWNVDVSSGSISSDVEQIDESQIENVAEGIDEGDERYDQVGTVYQDEETGDLYIVK